MGKNHAANPQAEALNKFCGGGTWKVALAKGETIGLDGSQPDPAYDCTGTFANHRLALEAGKRLSASDLTSTVEARTVKATLRASELRAMQVTPVSISFAR